MAFFSVAVALGILTGSAGGGLLFPLLGFKGLVLAGGTLCLLSVVIAVREPMLNKLVMPAEPQATTA